MLLRPLRFSDEADEQVRFLLHVVSVRSWGKLLDIDHIPHENQGFGVCTHIENASLPSRSWKVVKYG